MNAEKLYYAKNRIDIGIFLDDDSTIEKMCMIQLSGSYKKKWGLRL